MASANTERDPDRLWLNKGATFNIANSLICRQLYNRNQYGWYLNILSDGRYEVVYDDREKNDCLGAMASPSVLLQVDAVTLGEKTEEGELVKSVRQTWSEIVKQIRLQNDFLFEFTKVSRAFEMFLAATYQMDGFDKVVLTPRSNDRGRDVIASKTGTRILEQAKAYGVRRRVTHEEVRAMGFVVVRDKLPSKGAITTTSDFAPTIYSSDEFQGFVPDILELRNGPRLCEWLFSLVEQPTQSKQRS